MKRCILLISIGLFLLHANPIVAQSVLGTWKTVDDESGNAKSHVKIYEQNGKLYGKIVTILDGDPDAKCTECPDEGKFDSRNQPMEGLVIIKGLKKNDEEWEADDGIMDPEDGKIYDCKVWVDQDNKDKLNVRGYVGFFYRTQEWYRIN